MALSDDFALDYINKIVYHNTGTTVYTVNAFYSWLMDDFDELGQMDDDVPMSAQTPTSYTMINGWYLQELATQFLEGGAIQTSGYTDEIRRLICGSPSWVNFVAGDIGALLTGTTTTDTGTILDYNNTTYNIWIRMIDSGDTFDDAAEAYTSAVTGSGLSTAISVTGETEFANPYTLGTLNDTLGDPALYIFQDGEKIPTWYPAGHFDILIKTSCCGTVIDSKVIWVADHTWQSLYDSFEITLTTAGQNAVPLGTGIDLNNDSTEAAIEDYTDGTSATVAIAFGFSTPYSYDIGDGNGVQDYEVQVDCNGQRLSIVYEVFKWWTRDTSVTQLEETSDGNFVDGEEYRYAQTTYAEVKQSPLGTFAGGTMFGARSVYFTNLHGDDVQAFQLVDKAGTTRNPPNYQSFAVTSVVWLDRVSIFLDDGTGEVDKLQYLLDGANPLNKITVSGSVPADTPTLGTIVVVDDDLSEDVYNYTSFSGSDFVISGGLTASTYAGTETSYVPYIYEVVASGYTSVSEAVIYVSDRGIITRVRKTGILPFETTGTFGSTGYSTAAIRTTDSIYTA